MTWMNDLASGLLETLWRASWQGVLLIAAVGLACGLLRHLPSAARCTLWWLACLRLVAAVAMPHPLDLAMLPAPTEDRAVQPSRHLPPIEITAIEESPAQAPNEQHWPWQAALAFLWLSGYCAVAAQAVRRIAAARRLLSRATLAPEAARQEAERLRAALGVRARVRVLQAADVSGPLLIGGVRPAVVLPGGQFELDAGARRLALAHELAHVKRLDSLLAFAPHLASVLFWFLPPVWWTVREYKLAREEACDALAMRHSSAAPRDYGRMLIALAGSDAGARRVAALQTAPCYRTMERRLRMLKISDQPRGRLARAGTGLMIAAVALCALPWRLVAQDRPAEPAAPTHPAPPVDAKPAATPDAVIAVTQEGMADIVATGRIRADKLSYKPVPLVGVRSFPTPGWASPVKVSGSGAQRRRLSFDFDDVSLYDALKRVCRAAPVDFRIDPDVAEAARGCAVTMRLTGATVQKALAMLMEASRRSGAPLTFRVEDGVYIFARVGRGSAEPMIAPPAIRGRTSVPSPGGAWVAPAPSTPPAKRGAPALALPVPTAPVAEGAPTVVAPPTAGPRGAAPTPTTAPETGTRKPDVPTPVAPRKP